MTSWRNEANRANAAKSTGPRTAAGKARASKNALRHGLSAAAPDDQGLGGETGQIAALLCQGDERLAPAARIAAAAQSHLNRVRSAKHYALRAAILHQGEVDPAASPQEILARALIEAADELVTLNGYERKALSRRKRAVRNLYE